MTTGCGHVIFDCNPLLGNVVFQHCKGECCRAVTISVARALVEHKLCGGVCTMRTDPNVSDLSDQHDDQTLGHHTQNHDAQVSDLHDTAPPTRAEGALRPAPARTASGFTSWRGRSGRVYSARIELLLDCRAPARAAYLLVARDACGCASAVCIGVALSRAPTLNLARIRHRAAKYGANEVHMIDMTHSAGTYTARRVVRDVRAGLVNAAP
jgi:hypothetical protein